MMLDVAWLAVSEFRKIFLSGLGQDLAQARQVRLHQTRSSMSLWTFMDLVHGNGGPGRSHPQTVPTKLGA